MMFFFVSAWGGQSDPLEDTPCLSNKKVKYYDIVGWCFNVMHRKRDGNQPILNQPIHRSPPTLNLNSKVMKTRMLAKEFSCIYSDGTTINAFFFILSLL